MAEVNTNPTEPTNDQGQTQVNQTPSNNEPDAPQLSAEEQLAQLKVEIAKQKRAMDKAMSETASYKKQLREKLSADEVALQEKAEKEAQLQEEFESLKRENTITKYEKNFLALGYDAELANKAASAQFDGDTDELFKIQQSFISTRHKAMEAEWMKKQPTPPSGNGNAECPISKKQFESFGYTKRIEFKSKYPETYKKYTE